MKATTIWCGVESKHDFRNLLKQILVYTKQILQRPENSWETSKMQLRGYLFSGTAFTNF